MKSSTILILVALVATALTASIDQTLYNKVVRSTPVVDNNAYFRLATNANKWGSLQAYYVHTSKMMPIVSKKVNLNLAGKHQTFMPFADFEALKWGTKLENLSS